MFKLTNFLFWQLQIVKQTLWPNKIGDSLLVSEDEVKYKAYHCKGNAYSSQDGEDDSEGKIY